MATKAELFENMVEALMPSEKEEKREELIQVEILIRQTSVIKYIALVKDMTMAINQASALMSGEDSKTAESEHVYDQKLMSIRTIGSEVPLQPLEPRPVHEPLNRH